MKRGGVVLGVEQAGVQQVEFGVATTITVFADELRGGRILLGGIRYACFVQAQVTGQQGAFGKVGAHIAAFGDGVGGIMIGPSGRKVAKAALVVSAGEVRDRL